MSNTDNVERLSNLSTPNYLGDREQSNILAKRIQNYYHSQGYTNVRCWVETLNPSDMKNKVYGVRSNIVFSLKNMI